MAKTLQQLTDERDDIVEQMETASPEELTKLDAKYNKLSETIEAGDYAQEAQQFEGTVSDTQMSSQESFEDTINQANEDAATPDDTKSDARKFAEEREKDREALFREAGIEFDETTTPERYKETVDQFNTRVEGMMQDVRDSHLTAKDKKEFGDAIAKYDEARQKISDAYDKGVKRTEMAEIIEIFGKALGQLAVGWYGLKHGVDMSGVKFELSDWSGRYKRLAGKLERGLDRVEKSEKQTRADYRAREEQADKLARQKGEREERAFYTEKSDHEAREARRVATAEGKQREARRYLANDLIEFHRNLEKDAKAAKTAKGKKSDQVLKGLQEQRRKLTEDIRVLKDATDNLSRAVEAGDQEEAARYGREAGMTNEQIKAFKDGKPGSWGWFEDKTVLTDYMDKKQKLYKHKLRLLNDKSKEIQEHLELDVPDMVTIQNKDGSFVEGPRANADAYLKANPGSELVE
ncbi:MAG: hypothetical protein GTO54_00045 [Nitrososphaeria archaeon]|nr:hypothetical protein [Nitrososphaeria archaeon]